MLGGKLEVAEWALQQQSLMPSKATAWHRPECSVMERSGIDIFILNYPRSPEFVQDFFNFASTIRFIHGTILPESLFLAQINHPSQVSDLKLDFYFTFNLLLLSISSEVAFFSLSNEELENGDSSSPNAKK